MFKVSFNCADSALPDILALLEGRVPVRVQHCADAGEVLQNKARVAKAQAASITAKKAMANQKRREAQAARRAEQGLGPTQKEKAIELVRSIGLKPFRASELIERSKEKGLSKPAVYQAIYAEIAAGNLRKLDFGLYQKTGAGTGLTAVG